MDILTLRQNMVWTLFGNGIYAGCQWVMLVVLAQFGGNDVLGRFALGLAVTAPVTIFFQFALRQVLVTDAEGIYTFQDYLSIRIIAVVIGWLFILFITLLGDYSSETIAVILAVGLFKAFESISDIFYGLSQRHQRLDLVARSLVLRGILGALSLTLIFYITDRLLPAVLSVAVTWAAILLFYDVPISRRWWINSKNSGLIKSLYVFRHLNIRIQLAWLALPLGLTVTLVSLNTNIPRYFIESYFGEAVLGVFTAMAYLVIAVGMVVNAVGQAASPRLANYFAKGDIREFWVLLGKMLIIGVVLGSSGVLIALIYGREILTLLYGEEFARNIGDFVWMMIAGMVSYIASFLGYGMTAQRIFKAQLWLFIIVIGVNIVGCLLFVPFHGISGAIWGWTCALFIKLLLSFWLNVRGLRQSNWQKVML